VKKIRIVFSLMVVLMFVISSNTYSQSGKIPPFKMIQANGKLFSAQDLPIGKPVIIIYFSPDCEDCHNFIEAMLLRMDDFWNASIAMITYQPVPNVAQYVLKNKLNIYPNIYIGTEENFFVVRYYYNVKRFPFIALYNKNGDLIKIWSKNENIDDLSNRLNAL